MKFKTALAAAAALTLASAAQAQIGPQVGATVYGPEGGVVGTIEQMEGGVVVVNTGTYAAPVPADALGEGPDGPVISVTKAQLNELFAQQQAQAFAARDAALIVGAAVDSPNGVAVGTIESITGDQVVLAMPEGSVALMRENFAAGETGTLVVLYTQAQLVAALNGAAGGETAEADAG